jgi:ketosteroid isomerase-like protein
MSKENVELVRRWYDGLNAIGRTEPGGVDLERIDAEIWARVDPDAEIHERPDLPDAKVYRGREAGREFFRKTWDLFAEIRWEPKEIVDFGDVVVVTTRVRAIGRGSDVPVEMDEAAAIWFRDGLIVRVAGFPDKRRALAAAGMDPPGS